MKKGNVTIEKAHETVISALNDVRETCKAIVTEKYELQRIVVDR